MGSENRFLLPDLLIKPVMMLWTMILPQVVLLLINLSSIWIILDEVADRDLHKAYLIISIQVFLLLLFLYVWHSHKRIKSDIGFRWNLFLFFVQIIYLWYSVTDLWSFMPSNIEPWVLSQNDVMLSQFTFMMPGLFYAGIRVACVQIKLNSRSDLGVSLLIAVLAPVLFYGFFAVVGSRLLSSGSLLGFIIVPLFFIALTIIQYIGIIRALVIIMNHLQKSGQIEQGFWVGGISLLGPIAGLLLNKAIHFPADFQSPWVYVLAIINGLIVLIPTSKRSEAYDYVLFARAASFPFTFYFFLVFLPFLPLALPTILALGTGFLILVPLFLFLVHTKKLFWDFRTSQKFGSLKRAWIITLLGLCILPGYFLVQALMDKMALKHALTYVYSSDYSKSENFNGSADSVGRALLRLKDSKEGIQLPYLTAFYNQVVFEGMVLPDKKIDYMYKLFIGKDMPALKDRQRFGWASFQRGRPRAGRIAPVVNRQVDLESLDVRHESMGELVRSTVHLEMVNKGGSNRAEFMRDIHLPQGVLITGFKLKVNGEMEPGKIFEKRTALWVYHMIRDFTQRDPGMLTYKSPNLVNLNIYPFDVNEKRVAEIEFQFPRGMMPEIQIDEKVVALEEEKGFINNNVIVMRSNQGANAAVVFTKEVLSFLPSMKRQPYLHFILDASREGGLDAKRYKERIDFVVSQYPHIKNAKITVANFNIEQITNDPIEVDELKKIDIKTTLLHQGALDVGRVIQKELYEFQNNQNAQWQEYPLFVLITRNAGAVVMPSDLENFAYLSDSLPDINYFMIVESALRIDKKMLFERLENFYEREVVVLRMKDQIEVIPVEKERMSVVGLGQSNNSEALMVYDPKDQQFKVLGSVKIINDAEGKYLKGLDLVRSNIKAFANPSDIQKRLSSIVQESRALQVMTPATSFITVERSSQWKTLSLKEGQRLRASEGLEFDEPLRTPAPSAWLLIVLFLIVCMVKDKLFQRRLDVKNG